MMHLFATIHECDQPTNNVRHGLLHRPPNLPLIICDTHENRDFPQKFEVCCFCLLSVCMQFVAVAVLAETLRASAE